MVYGNSTARPFAVILAILLTCNAAASPPEHAECNELYEIAVAAAVPILPPPLHGFFETHLEALRQSAAPGAQRPSGSKRTAGEPQWHYVTLDIAAGATGIDERRAAARRFPRERAKAMALCESYGVRDAGILPWVVQDRYDDVVQAFRSGEPQRIVAESGVLLHFCTDAAMPCNTATDRPRRQLAHTELFNRLKKRLEYEVRVAPDRLSPVKGPLDATFEVLLNAHRAADDVVALDASALPGAGEAHAERLAEGAASILETQIESGALLAANLIAAAWAEAGKPDLKTAALVPPPQAVVTPDAVAPVFVGSRNSTVYHLSACNHAQRIKQENRVTFDTQELARAAGRTACKTCKPDARGKPQSR